MSARSAVTFAVWFLVIGGSAEAQGSRADQGAVRAEVNAAWRRWEAITVAGDSVSAAAFFTAEAAFAFGTEVRGANAIREYWARNHRGFKWEQAAYTMEEFALVDDLAFDFGWLTQRWHPRVGGESTNQRMRYAAIWQRQTDGTWKLHRWLVTLAALPSG